MKEEYHNIMIVINDLLELLEDVDTDNKDLDDSIYDTIEQLEELKRALSQT